MKKIVAIITAITMLCSLSIAVSAENDVVFTSNGDTVSFTVSAGNDAAGYSVSAKLLRPGKTELDLESTSGSIKSILAGVSQGVLNENGSKTFTFDIVGDAGYYIFSATVPKFKMEFSKEIPFAPSSAVKALIADLSELTYSSESVKTVKALFDKKSNGTLSGAEVLGLEAAEKYDVYEKMTAKEKDSLYDFLTYEFGKMEGTEEKSEIYAILTNVIIIEDFLLKNEKDTIKAMKSDAEALKLSETECYKELFLSENYGTDELLSEMVADFKANIKNVEDKANIPAKFSESMFMTVLKNCATDGEIGKVMEKLPLYMKEIGISEDYEDAVNREEIWEEAASADSLLEFVEAVNDNISLEEEPKKSDGSSGSGGGGGGKVALRSETVVAPNELLNSFSDIENVAWAKDAINYLADSGIISGKEIGKFYPNDVLKREELAKILTLSFALDGTPENIEFADVDAESWYYPYVLKTLANGVINGNGESFGIGLAVTREDAATMIYRAIKDTVELTEEEKTEFSDDAEIAEYAKEAVYALKQLKILDGVGDNAFAPKKNVTRAELAKIIYSVLKEGEAQ